MHACGIHNVSLCVCGLYRSRMWLCVCMCVYEYVCEWVVCACIIYVCAYNVHISEMRLSTLGHKPGVPFLLVLDLLLTATWNRVPPTPTHNGRTDTWTVECSSFGFVRHLLYLVEKFSCCRYAPKAGAMNMLFTWFPDVVSSWPQELLSPE